MDYLAGKRMPGADALMKMAGLGVDVNLLLLGSADEIISKDDLHKNVLVDLDDKKIRSIIERRAIEEAEHFYQDNKDERFPVAHIVKLVEGYTQTLWEAYVLLKSVVISEPRTLEEALPQLEKLFGPELVAEMKRVGQQRP